MGKRIVIVLLLAGILGGMLALPAGAVDLQLAAPSAVLMDLATGTVLYETNSHERLAPASVTKVMTLLLIMEAVDSGKISWQDTVTASEAAAAKGGSQVYLKVGETMSVEEMVKSITVSSANDCACAMAEFLAGSEAGFVEKMNARAKELGMEDTHFVNCTGLDDEPSAAEHLTSAYDIALMSRELLLHHPDIKKFTTIWMDTVRNGAFGLANTNKLVRFYEGTTGLKTGSTDAAGYCMSATAERDGMELIAVILKSSTRDIRNEAAKSLLSYGFANYTLMDVYPGQALPPIDVLLGEREQVQPVLAQSSRILVDKSQVNAVTTQVSLCEDVEAPVEAGQKLGEMAVSIGGEPLQTIPIVAGEAVERITIPGIFSRLLRNLFMAG